MADNEAYSLSGCAKCGACSTVCPIFQVEGRESLTARGKLHLLDRLPAGERSEVFAEIFSKCLLCGACRETCPNSLDIPRAVIEARGNFSRLTGRSFLQYLARQSLTRPLLFSSLNLTAGVTERLLTGLLPSESGLRLRLAGLAVNPLFLPATTFIEASLRSSGTLDSVPAGQDRISYFVGCQANYMQPEIGTATAELVRKITGSRPVVPAEQICCGLAAHAAGDSKEARRLARRNIASFADIAGPILTSCGSCYAHLLAYKELFIDDPEWAKRAADFTARLHEFSTFFSDRADRFSERSAGGSALPAQKVLYHDPCHLRFSLGITEAPRRLIRSLAGAVESEPAGGPQCCGQGGLFQIAHQGLSMQIGEKLLTNIAGTGADVVTTTCSGCLLKLQQGLAVHKFSARVLHLAVLLNHHLQE